MWPFPVLLWCSSCFQVLVTLDHLERVSTFQEFVQIFSQFGNEMVEFAHLTGDRQNVSGILRNTIWFFLLEEDKNPQFTLKKKSLIKWKRLQICIRSLFNSATLKNMFVYSYRPNLANIDFVNVIFWMWKQAMKLHFKTSCTYTVNVPANSEQINNTRVKYLHSPANQTITE